MSQDNCKIMQPPILISAEALVQEQTFPKGSKFSAFLHFDDVTFQIKVDKDGQLWTSNLFSFVNTPDKSTLP